MANYIAGVHSLQKLAGYEIPADSPNLKLIMDGIQVDLMKPANQAVPMMLQILKDISEFVNFNNEYELCTYTAMLAGFYLVLRSSNLVPTSTNNFNLHEQLTRWHVGIDSDLEFVIVLVEWSKNNLNYKHELWVPIKQAKDLKICFVRTLDQFFH